MFWGNVKMPSNTDEGKGSFLFEVHSWTVYSPNVPRLRFEKNQENPDSYFVEFIYLNDITIDMVLTSIEIEKFAPPMV